MSGPVGGHTISRAAERVLRAHLDEWSVPAGLGSVRTWDAVPTMDALSVADLPAGCIAVPGLAQEPTRTSDGYSGAFDLEVGLFCRAPEGESQGEAPRDDEDEDDAGWTRTYEATAQWAAFVRTVILRHLLVELQGIATAVTWTGEDLQAARPSSARTLGGAAVSFTVTVPELDDSELLPPLPDGSPVQRPRVQRVTSSVRVLAPGHQPPTPLEPGSDVLPPTEVPPVPSG